MAYDDEFRDRSRLSSDEVRDICRIKSSGEVLDLAGFGEPMTDWAKRVDSLGQTVLPRTVYVVEVFEQHEHRVAWVYHSWREPDEIVEMHHIACDCVATMDNPDEQLSEISDCPAVIAALEHRAERVSQRLQTSEFLDTYDGSVQSRKLKPTAVATAKAVINFVMNYDKAHPEGWVANTMSGEHQIPLLSLLLQVHPYKDLDAGSRFSKGLSVQEIIEEMDADGSLVLNEDGVTVSLPTAA